MPDDTQVTGSRLRQLTKEFLELKALQEDTTERLRKTRRKLREAGFSPDVLENAIALVRMDREQRTERDAEVTRYARIIEGIV